MSGTTLASSVPQRHLRVVPPAVEALDGRACGCGHAREAHVHYRRGSDCGACGCGRYHRPLLRARTRSA
jgi:hypothetical protein